MEIELEASPRQLPILLRATFRPRVAAPIRPILAMCSRLRNILGDKVETAVWTLCTLTFADGKLAEIKTAADTERMGKY